MSVIATIKPGGLVASGYEFIVSVHAHRSQPLPQKPLVDTLKPPS